MAVGLHTVRWYFVQEDEGIFVEIGGYRVRTAQGKVCGPILSVEPYRRKINGQTSEDSLFFQLSGMKKGKALFIKSFMFDQNDFSRLFKNATDPSTFIKILMREDGTITTNKSGKKKTSQVLHLTQDGEKDVSINLEQSAVDVSLLDVDHDILQKKIGRYEVKISDLLPPPQSLMCRNINDAWVQQIKSGLARSPVPHTVVLPCLLLDKEFDERNLSNSRICTLGGNHLRIACQEVLKTMAKGDNLDDIRIIQIDLYKDLTVHEALRLGNLHNAKSETSQLTLQDIVRQIRRKLYRMTSTPENEEPPREPPNFRRECCLEMALGEKMVKTMGPLFIIASYPTDCWLATEEIFKKVDEGIIQSDVKSFKVNKSMGRTLFQNIQGLNHPDKLELLRDIAAGTMKISEANKKAHKLKKRQNAAAAFVFITKSKDWEDARTKFPNHTTDTALSPFIKLFSSKSKAQVPKDFLSFAEKAMTDHQSPGPSRTTPTIEIEVSFKVGGEDVSASYQDQIQEFRNAMFKFISNERAPLHSTPNSTPKRIRTSPYTFSSPSPIVKSATQIKKKYEGIKKKNISRRLEAAYENIAKDAEDFDFTDYVQAIEEDSDGWE